MSDDVSEEGFEIYARAFWASQIRAIWQGRDFASDWWSWKIRELRKARDRMRKEKNGEETNKENEQD